jgi:hypothetical protein
MVSKRVGLHPPRTRAYRVLGHEDVALTKAQLEHLVAIGTFSVDTKVFRDGEGFATALSCRPEFRHLVEHGVASPATHANATAPTGPGGRPKIGR